jgi:hypothetical protein
VAREIAQCIPLLERNQGAVTGNIAAEETRFRDLAMEALAEAFASGFSDRDGLRSDEVFSILQEHPKCEELLGQKPNPK